MIVSYQGGLENRILIVEIIEFAGVFNVRIDTNLSDFSHH